MSPSRTTRVALGLALLLVARSGSGCTVIGVGRDASADGSVMVAHTDDSGGMGDPRLVHVPARDWPAGSQRNVYLSIADYPRLIAPERAPEYEASSSAQASLPWATPLGSIPQVPHTYAYWDVDYGLGNEHGLILAETTCAGRLTAAPRGYPNGSALFGIEELSKIALERCASARCAALTMGRLAEAHGFYGGNGHLGKLEPWGGLQTGGAAEALAIGDADGELWAFHILPGTGEPGRGAVWAAQRMPPDSVTVLANAFIIRQMDLSNPSDFLASANVSRVAAELGFWEPPAGSGADGAEAVPWDADGAFDFTAAFGGSAFPAAADPADPSGRKRLITRFYSGRRIWRVFDLLAPSLRLDPDWGYLQEAPTYPQAVVPEQPVSVRRFFGLLRDHYEGTPFDLTAGLAAGPYGSPNRWGPGAGEREVSGGWERAISMHRSLFAFVAQSRPAAEPWLRGLVWFGEDSPHATCFVPFFLSQPSLPSAYTTGSMGAYSDQNAWWAAQAIKRTMDLQFSAMRADVDEAARMCEDAGEAAVARAEARARALAAGAPPAAGKRVASGARAGGDAAAVGALEEAMNQHALWAFGEWKRLFGQLMVAYKNGYRNELVADGVSRESGIGYPAWWLRAVGYGDWAERVRARADEADRRRAAGEPLQPLQPAPTPGGGGGGDAGRARRVAAARSLGERVGMALCALLGALLIFALGVLGGHRLDRVRRPHAPGGGVHAPLLPAGAVGAGARAGASSASGGAGTV